MERWKKRRLNPRFVILCAVLAALTLAVGIAGISKLLGDGDLPAEDLPEDTSLRRKAKVYLAAGGKIGAARGALARQ